jgi:hypothetical protein
VLRMRFLRHRIYEISAGGSGTRAAHEVVVAHSPLAALAKARRACGQSTSICERVYSWQAASGSNRMIAMVYYSLITGLAEAVICESYPNVLWAIVAVKVPVSV